MKTALFLIAATALASCKGDIDNQCASMGSRMQKCAVGTLNTLNGLGNVFSSSTSSVSINVAGMSKEILNVMCENKNAIQKYLTCIYGELDSCMPDETRGLQPSVDSYVKSLTYLCDNVQDVDFTCVAANTQQVTACVLGTSNTPPSDMANRDSLIKYTCGILTTTNSCYKNAISDCSGKTAEIMTKYMEYQTPPACDATMVRISWGLLVISLCYTWLKKMF